MNDDLRAPAGEPLFPPAELDARALPALAAALPGAAFTASVLLDVLALVADGPAHARSYIRAGVEVLKVGLGASLAALAIGAIDGLKLAPETPAGQAATKRLAIDGAVVAIYLLDLAAREKQLADQHGASIPLEPGPIGWSLTGLALLGATGKLKLPSGRGM